MSAQLIEQFYEKHEGHYWLVEVYADGTISGRILGRWSDRKHYRAAKTQARATHVATDPFIQMRYIQQVLST